MKKILLPVAIFATAAILWAATPPEEVSVLPISLSLTSQIADITQKIKQLDPNKEDEKAAITGLQSAQKTLQQQLAIQIQKDPELKKKIIAFFSRVPKEIVAQYFTLKSGIDTAKLEGDNGQAKLQKLQTDLTTLITEHPPLKELE